jgi:hypothetical protein
MKKIPLMMIDWLDAYISDEDTPELDDTTKHYTRSVGWLAKKDKEFIYLSHFFDGIGGELSSPFTSIPKKMIKHQWELEIKDES